MFKSKSKGYHDDNMFIQVFRLTNRFVRRLSNFFPHQSYSFLFIQVLFFCCVSSSSYHSHNIVWQCHHLQVAKVVFRQTITPESAATTTKLNANLEEASKVKHTILLSEQIYVSYSLLLDRKINEIAVLVREPD